ncbi:mechanosensitive ion channel family protein [Mastigocoleus testarum]|uniref:Mechanosensitive ion channel protein MscS n=1 Tax=Mastigocoleus testarum BC008 TaxID=371196 RepID=A0A0V7ZD16_9CYAN|nr:mechanosensitive ion channel family protein [Mastigocoleus testarum]KST62410.1 mechanosensitive ion channel protein MscS [Mastigocoleus testarum BC008]
MALVETIKSSIKELISNAILIFPALLTALIIILLTRFVAQLVAGIATKLGEKAIRSKSLQILLSKTVYVATWTVGILLAAVIAFPGLRLGDIIATLGLSSVAIGFAFQDIFKNFLAGILLLLQEPFRIGDQIIIGDYEGTVEQVDIRTTKIRTYTGERVLLPNSKVFTSAVQVRTAFNSRRTDLAVGVDYNTPLSKASEILKRSVSQVDGVLQDPAPEIDLIGFGDSSIDFAVRYWTLPQQTEVRRVKTRAIISIKRVFDNADINIPYPIRTLYFYNQQKFNDHLMPSEENSVVQNSSFDGSHR